MRKIGIFLKKYIPVYAFVAFSFSLLSFAVYVGARSIPSFADSVDGSIGHASRRLLAWLTDALPFSLAELIIVLSPAIVALVIFLALRARGRDGKIRFAAGLLATVTLFLSVYSFTLGIGYHKTGIEVKLELEKTAVNADSLERTLSILANECVALADELEIDSNGASILPLDFAELSDDINDAYDKLSYEMPELGIKHYRSRAKRVLLSRPMSALEITGVYTFFTGEANVNVYYPDYCIPFTVAHELAHQRGIARENEANFVAFLVCIRSDSPYVRYSGFMNMLEYVASALNKTDSERYRAAYASFDPKMVSEIKAYSAFYHENKKQFWSTLSDTVNDTYLKAQGTEGIVSYGLVVRLCVAYYAE